MCCSCSSDSLVLVGGWLVCRVCRSRSHKQYHYHYSDIGREDIWVCRSRSHKQYHYHYSDIGRQATWSSRDRWWQRILAVVIRFTVYCLLCDFWRCLFDISSPTLTFSPVGNFTVEWQSFPLWNYLPVKNKFRNFCCHVSGFLGSSDVKIIFFRFFSLRGGEPLHRLGSN